MTTYIYLSDEEKAHVLDVTQQRGVAVEDFVRQAIIAALAQERESLDAEEKKRTGVAALRTMPLVDVPPLLPKRGVLGTLWMLGCEALYLSVACLMCGLAYWYFALWPVYRIVAFVIILILWSNCASATARNKTREQALRLWGQVTHAASLFREHQQQQKHEQIIVHPALSQDTTGFLSAVKAMSRGGTHVIVSEASRVQPTLPDHHRHSSLVGDPAHASIR